MIAVALVRVRHMTVTAAHQLRNGCTPVLVVVRGRAMTVRPGAPVLTWAKMSPAVPS